MGIVAYINEGDLNRPRPICAREGDVFKCVVFDEDLPFGFRKGGFVYVLVNCNLICGLYVIETTEGPTLALLEPTENGLRVQVNSLHASYPSFECKSTDLNITGRVTDAFPLARYDCRFVFYEDGLGFKPQELPYLVHKMKP